MCLLCPAPADGRGPLPVSVGGSGLLRLRWRDRSSLQPRRPALCLHAAAAARPRLWHLGRHRGQVRKSSAETRPLPGRDPPADQMLSIYRVSCLKWQHLTVEIALGCLRKSIAGFIEGRITIISLIIIITVLGNRGLIIFTLCLWIVWLIILFSVWGTKLS